MEKKEIETFCKKIWEHKNPTITKDFDSRKVIKYLKDNKYWYLSYILIFDYMEENKLFKEEESHTEFMKSIEKQIDSLWKSPVEEKYSRICDIAKQLQEYSEKSL